MLCSALLLINIEFMFLYLHEIDAQSLWTFGKRNNNTINITVMSEN